MSQRPMRVLIAAENASVRFGGEAILPYHYFRLLRRRGLDAHLVVHARTRPELTALFPQELHHLHFVEDTPLQKLLFLLGRLLPRRMDEATLGLATQMVTQWKQRAVLRSLVTPECVVHQPVPVSPRFPSLLYNLGAPVVIGPLNGGMEYPPAFRTEEALASRWVVALGRSLSNLANAILQGKRKAALVLVANARTRKVLPAGLRGRIVELPENAVDADAWGTPAILPQAVSQIGPKTGESRFLFVGRLVDWKALDLVVHALQDVPNAILEVVGDGPMLKPWRDLAAKIGVQDRVHFLGWLSQKECAERLNGCCALVLPSLYECGGAVVLEAMAMSRPVIATAWGGPAEYLNESCGVLIPPHSRTALIEGFARAMSLLASSPALCSRLGGAGRERLLRHFCWNDRIDQILELYQMSMGACTDGGDVPRLRECASAPITVE